MNKNKKVEIAMPLFFIFFSAYVIITGLDLPDVEGYFPIMIGVGMFLSALGILFDSLKKRDSIIALEKINVLNLVKISVTLLLYTLLLPRAGYFVSTVLLGIVTIHILGYKNKFLTVAYPLIIVTLLFLSFKVLLKVPLPVLFGGFF